MKSSAPHVFEAQNRVSLPSGQIQQMLRREFVRLTDCAEVDLPFKTMHHNLAWGLMFLQYFARDHHEAEDLDPFSLH